MIRLYMGDIHGDYSIAHEVYDHAIDTFLDGQIPDELIQVGDYGFGIADGMWNNSHGNHPLPNVRMFIDGNHEDHELLFTASDKILDGWKYMQRGSIVDRTGYLGGAASADKDLRIKHSNDLYGYVVGSIWSKFEELEQKDIFAFADAAGLIDFEFDTIVSHTFPSICDMLWATNPLFGSDERKLETTRMLLQWVYQNYRDQIKLWVGGHWHRGKHWRERDTQFVLLNTVSSLPSRNWEHINQCFYIEER